MLTPGVYEQAVATKAPFRSLRLGVIDDVPVGVSGC